MNILPCGMSTGAGLALLLMATASTETPTSDATATMRQATTIAQNLVGTWRLVSVSEEEDGQTIQSPVYGSHPVGYLMYDTTGHVCAQLINADRPLWKDGDIPTPEEARSAFNGFGGYCGRYEVQETEGYVSHFPEADIVPNEIGHVLKRSFTLRANRLVLQATERRAIDGRVTKKSIVWERVN